MPSALLIVRSNLFVFGPVGGGRGKKEITSEDRKARFLAASNVEGEGNKNATNDTGMWQQYHILSREKQVSIQPLGSESVSR